MPGEIFIDLSHPAPQPVVRPMSGADAAALAAAQAASQAITQADDTRRLAARAALGAFMANPTPTGADAILALKAVIRILARDL